MTFRCISNPKLITVGLIFKLRKLSSHHLSKKALTLKSCHTSRDFLSSLEPASQTKIDAPMVNTLLNCTVIFHVLGIETFSDKYGSGAWCCPNRKCGFIETCTNSGWGQRHQWCYIFGKPCPSFRIRRAEERKKYLDAKHEAAISRRQFETISFRNENLPCNNDDNQGILRANEEVRGRR